MASVLRRRAGLAVIAVLMVAAGSGCAADDTQAEAAQGAAADLREENTGTLVIEPLDALDGATREAFAGIGVDVPGDFEVSREEGEDQAVLNVLDDAGSGLVVRVFAESDTDFDLEIARRATLGEVKASDGVAAVEQVGIDWSSAGYATGLTYAGQLEDGTERDALWVAARNADATITITVAVRSDDGPVEDSIAYQMLRTLRFDG